MVRGGLFGFVNFIKHEMARIVGVLQNVEPEVARFPYRGLMVFNGRFNEFGYGIRFNLHHDGSNNHGVLLYVYKPLPEISSSKYNYVKNWCKIFFFYILCGKRYGGLSYQGKKLPRLND
jgi:hypothetical protein